MNRLLRAAALALCALALPTAAGGSGTQPVPWPTYGGALSSANLAPPRGLSPATAAKVVARWSRKTDGTVFAGPVIGVTPGGRRIVVVGTEANTLYGLDAQSGRVVWSRSLGAPVPACGGRYGITSTPAIDEATGLVYAVGARGVLAAFDLGTGHEQWQLQVVRRTTVENVWSGLRIDGNSLYVAVASYCDHPDKHGQPADGYLLRVDRVHRKVVGRFDVVPGPDNLGGIWGWGGVSVDPRTGSLFTATGNAIVSRGGDLIEDDGHAERVLRLSPALQVLDSTPPPTLTPDNRGDEDYGATPLLFQPAGCPPLVAANSKNGHSYVWRRDDLHGRPVWDAALGSVNPDIPFLGQPTYIPSLRLLVIAPTRFSTGTSTHSGVSAYRIDAACGQFTHLWDMNIGGGPQPPPVAIGGLLAASAPATNGLALVDARTGAIVNMLNTNAPVYAPVATDGASIFAATTGGVVSRYATR